jgi:hypothetical protein
MKVVVAYFKLLFQHLPGGREKNHETKEACQESWSPNQNSNLQPPNN